ncbi:hypothetical protein C874_16965 [Elizabethkingia anophelis 502]|nr:hypothetical protein C874_16965 [Elizabethkingia anophelis 502]
MFISVKSFAQINIQKIEDAKSLVSHKNEFIGKPLSFLLKNVQLEIKSVLAAPNKNVNQINTLYLRFVDIDTYLKTRSKEIEDRPTQIVITFNQNWGMEGDVCRYNSPNDINCVNWTKDDEASLGKLIIHDIRVIGRN